jgi:hypothetical protein
LKSLFQQPARARTWCWLECAALAALVALFVWRGLIPAWTRLDTDFPNYYLAAKLWKSGYPLERFYDWVWFQRQKDHAGITDQTLVGYIPLTYFSALVVAPLTALPPLDAKRVWLVLNLVLLGGTALLLRRMTRLGPVRVALITFLAIVPLRTNFQFGQQHLLLLSLFTLAAWLDARRRPFASGATLAAAAAIKLYPALFAVYYLRKRDWRALGGLAAGSAVVGVLGCWLFGFGPLRDYVALVMPRGLIGENNDPYGTALGSLTGLLRRLFVREPEENPSPLLDAPAVFVVAQPVVEALILVAGILLLSPKRREEPGRERLEWGAFLALLLAFSSAAATYHFCVLILAVALAAGYLWQEGRRRAAWCLVALHGAVCFPFYRLLPAEPSGWAILAGYPRAYLLTALYGVVLYALRAGALPLRPRAAAAFGVLFAVVIALGIRSNGRHLAGVAATYEGRLARRIPTILANTASVSGEDVYFGRMSDEGGAIDRTGAPLTLRVPLGSDVFHPAVTGSSADGFFELASRTSKILRFPRGATELVAAGLPVEIDDGEQPVVSRDGRWLAFLREDERGRGHLRIKDLRPADGPSADHPALGAPEDVLDVGFFPDDRLVVAARADGESRLYAADSTSGTFAPVATPEGASARYPAVAPDGRLLVYSRLEGGQWHLWLRDLARGDERRLTDGECNATEPAWFDDGIRVVYSTDCGRGLAHTALSVIAATASSPGP